MSKNPVYLYQKQAGNRTTNKTMTSASFARKGSAELKATTAPKTPKFGFVANKHGFMVYCERSRYEDRLVPKTYSNMTQAEAAAEKISGFYGVKAEVFGSHPYTVGYKA